MVIIRRFKKLQGDFDVIAIIMAVYNGEAYIQEQLDSICRQTYTDWRLIVRDDGSSDNTVHIIEKFAEKTDNDIIICKNNPPSGCAKNNFALLLEDAKDAEYVMCCDQDDVWMEDKIEVSLKAMKELEDKYGKDMPMLVHGDVKVVDDSLNIIAGSMFELSHILKNPLLSELIIQNNVTGCTMMVNQNLCSSIADIAGSNEIIMHDYLAALYAAVFGKTAFIDRALLSYRQHQENSVGAKDNNSIRYLFRRLKAGRTDYKAAMHKSYDQAGLFVKVFGNKMLKEGFYKEYKLFTEYSALQKESKFSRLRFYFKYKVWKCGTVRRIMQCIWG